MYIHAYGETDVGRSRTHNEDYILVEPDLGEDHARRGSAQQTHMRDLSDVGPRLE